MAYLLIYFAVANVLPLSLLLHMCAYVCIYMYMCSIKWIYVYMQRALLKLCSLMYSVCVCMCKHVEVKGQL